MAQLFCHAGQMPPVLLHKAVRKARLGVVLGALDAPGGLAALYGGTDKTEHGYFPYYRRHLGPRRFARNVVFEIGVGGNELEITSGSLFVWRDYLLRSTIVGIDLHPKRVALGPRVAFVRADQGDPEELGVAVTRHGRPDVVIDDGSHVGEHIWTSFATLWPLLPPGGLYVVEDLSTSWYPAYGGGDPAPATTGAGLVQQWTVDAQAADPTFRLFPQMGQRSVPRFADIAAVHVYPGIAFVQKAGQPTRRT